MPGIVLFDRKLRYASDDLIIPATANFLAHTAFLITSAILSTQIPESCGPQSLWIFQYFITSCCVFGLQMLDEALVGYFSLQGTLADERPRSPIRIFLYVWIILNLVDIGLQVLAVASYAIGSGQCREGHTLFNNGLLAAMIIFFLYALKNILSFIFFMIVSKPRVTKGPIDQGRWRFWAGLLTPVFVLANSVPFATNAKSKGGEDTGNLYVLAEYIAGLFSDDDLTTSDIAAGLFLVKEKQKEAERQRPVERESQGSISRSSDGGVDNLYRTGYSPKPDDADERIHDVITFYKYAEAIYGRPVSIFDSFGKGVLELFIPWLDRQSETPIQVAKRSIDHGWTSCAFCWSPAICQSSGGSHPDLIHLSRKCGVFTSPYMIALDHTERAVVISVRGSLSIADLLITDICFNPTLVKFTKSDGKPGVFYTHSGMWQTAQNVYEDILKNGHLDELLLKPGSAWKNYKIMVVGHGLGGAAASLVGHLLRESRRFPQTIKALVYSVPGCITCENGIDYFQEFCTAVVTGDEVLPYCSGRSFQRLGKRVLYEISSSNQRKVDVFASRLGRSFLVSQKKKVQESVYDPEKIIVEYSEKEPIRTFMPGHILHFVRTGNKPETTGSKRRKYLNMEFSPIWKDSFEFNDLELKKNMILDHMPNRTLHILEDWCDHSPTWIRIQEKRKNGSINAAEGIYDTPIPSIPPPTFSQIVAQYPRKDSAITVARSRSGSDSSNKSLKICTNMESSIPFCKSSGSNTTADIHLHSAYTPSLSAKEVYDTQILHDREKMTFSPIYSPPPSYPLPQSPKPVVTMSSSPFVERSPIRTHSNYVFSNDQEDDFDLDFYS